MEYNDFLEMFIEESKEHLQYINDELLKLEAEPDNTSIVNEIFRSAHTLKGMAATMGFEDFSQFAAAGVPTLMYSVGSVPQERLDAYERAGGIPSLHSAEYHPDAETTLETAFRTATAAMLELFRQGN